MTSGMCEMDVVGVGPTFN